MADINRADFVFHGKKMSVLAPDVQTLQACLVRFASNTYIDAHKKLIPGPVRRIVDVGACIGLYTLMYHEIWPEAEIWAFEPNSTAFHYLMLNTAHIPGVRHFNLALGEGTYTHTLAMPTVEQKKFLNYPEGNIGISSMFGESDIYKEEVHVVRLDNMIDWCDFVKIDVEGYEQKVLTGMERLLKESRPLIHLEFVKQNREISGMSSMGLRQFIVSFNYTQVGELYQDRVFCPSERVATGN